MEKELLFESHAHYDDRAFDEDREELLASLAEQGIGCVVNVGAGIRSVRDTLELMERYSFLYGALGIHPSEVGELNEEYYEWLKEECLRGHRGSRQGKVVAVGEIGLDYYWDVPERDIQRKWFARQIHLAREVKLPLIIHSREAAAETADILRAEQAQSVGGVIHCYSYSPEMVREFLNMGFYIGIGGVVTFSNARKLKEAVKYIPLERILLETDCPYLAPTPFRGRRNSSLNLPYIAAEIAAIKEVALTEVIAVTARNGRDLFGI